MTKVVYKSYNRNEGSLFPVYLSDMVPAEHPARVVDAVVEGLDLSALERTYKGGGTSSYSPRTMLKVVFFFSGGTTIAAEDALLSARC